MACVTDTGDIVHVYIVKFGQLDKAFDWHSDFAFFIIRVGGLGNINRVCNFCLVQVMIIPESFYALNV